MLRRDFFLTLAAALPLLRQAPPKASRAGRRQVTVQVAPLGRAEVLRPVRGVPPEIVGLFRHPLAFQQDRAREYFVFDRLGHSVYRIDAEMKAARKIIQIGFEKGNILEPTAFALSPEGTFVVADRPAASERVQLFASTGFRLGGFTLPGRAPETLVLNGVVLNGVGSLQYRGRSVFISQPETGALITEYDLDGAALRTFGSLRGTGYEKDRDLHLAFNSGLPLLIPGGGFYFVFQAGIPMFRRYDASGTLLFERHVEGLELDPILANLPTSWPKRASAGGETPMVPPVVRTAAVDGRGNLWIAFTAVPCIYVYDSTGEKKRTVQLTAAGTISATGLFFAPTGRLLVTPGCYEFDPAGKAGS